MLAPGVVATVTNISAGKLSFVVAAPLAIGSAVSDTDLIATHVARTLRTRTHAHARAHARTSSYVRRCTGIPHANPHGRRCCCHCYRCYIYTVVCLFETMATELFYWNGFALPRDMTWCDGGGGGCVHIQAGAMAGVRPPLAPGFWPFKPYALFYGVLSVAKRILPLKRSGTYWKCCST